MKKLIAMVLAMLLVPTMALGMQSMDNGEMEGVTGQAGVNIAIDDFKMYQNIQGLWYTDTDGITTINKGNNLGMDAISTAGGAASIGIDELNVMVEVNAITSAAGSNVNDLGSTGRDLQGTFNDIEGETVYNNNDNDAFNAKPITIDVTSALPVLSTAAASNGFAGGVPGVRIELGTMEVVQTALQFDVQMNDGSPLTSPNQIQTAMEGVGGDASYGQISIEKTSMAILDGSVEIAPH